MRSLLLLYKQDISCEYGVVFVVVLQDVGLKSNQTIELCKCFGQDRQERECHILASLLCPFKNNIKQLLMLRDEQHGCWEQAKKNLSLYAKQVSKNK